MRTSFFKNVWKIFNFVVCSRWRPNVSYHFQTLIKSFSSNNVKDANKTTLARTVWWTFEPFRMFIREQFPALEIQAPENVYLSPWKREREQYRLSNVSFFFVFYSNTSFTKKNTIVRYTTKWYQDEFICDWMCHYNSGNV